MSIPKTLATLVAISCFFCATAQKKSSSYEFKKITSEDFSASYPNIDLGNGAVVIADVGESSFEGNVKGWFSLVYKHKTRIQILNKKAFDIATVNIPLYKSVTSEDEEKLESLKASTFNLQDGKVEETKLEKSGIFSEQLDKSHLVKKFTMPAIKEGSIIEYSYTVLSDFLFNLQPWSFQGSYPRVWSEYQLNLPEYFDYAMLAQGYQPFAIKEITNGQQKFGITINGNSFQSSERIVLNSKNKEYLWIMKEVPALKEEPFTSNLENYISKIQFQLQGQRLPEQEYRQIMSNWPKVASTLMKDDDFMGEFSKSHSWSKDLLEVISLEKLEGIEKANKIYNYVQENFTNLGGRGIYLTKSLKEVAKLRQGYSQEINMLLVLLLKEANLESHPVLVSTKNHSFISDVYPIMEQYNYLVVKLQEGERTLYLDAATKSIGFGKLPLFCYRNMGISIQETPVQEDLSTQTVSENKFTEVLLYASKDPKVVWGGNVSSSFGYFESATTRNELIKNAKYLEEKIKNSLDDRLFVDSVTTEKMKKKEEPLQVSYKLTVVKDNEPNLIYFNPIFKEGREQFTLKSLTRTFPVELPHKYLLTYKITVEAPNGYLLDEAPKSTRVNYNEDEGSFDYIVEKSDSKVAIRATLRLNRTSFPPEEYEQLQQFFNYVSKKYSEQIIFKKTL